MKTSHTRSILATLFIPYTTLFIIALISVIIFFIISDTKKIQQNSFASIENNLITTLDNFDQMAASLDSLSQNVLYSNLVKDHFSKYVDYTQTPSTTDRYSNTQNTKALYDLLVVLLGPNAPCDQLYLYGLSSGSFGIGLDNSVSSTNVQEFSWYSNVLENNGEKFIFLDYDKRLTPYYSYEEGRYFLTLIREYYSSLNVPQGIIEVKKSIAPLINTIESYTLSYQEKFFILSPEGQVIYPVSTSSSDAAKYYDIISDPSVSEELLDKCSLKHADNKYIFYQTSKYSKFTAAAVVDKASLMSPIRDNIFSSFWILLIACAAIIGVSYMISQQISKPLGQIYSRISSFQVNSDELTDAELPEINTPVLELNVLYQALVRMQSHARTALERELQLQNREMQSRMLALQAQMNPHFLYNSLATIQAMAAEGMTEEIDMMCQNISNILRYISADSQQLVNLNEEVAHTWAYLECMKVRYDHELSYSIDIPEAMQECKIPKLCLQLIVENAIKFTTRKRGPWMVSITGQLNSVDWILQIKDNGPGFTDDELDALQQKIKQIDETEILPNLEINGMGLMNIYIRFKLLYKGKHIFRLSNNVPEGACVTIGGTIQ